MVKRTLIFSSFFAIILIIGIIVTISKSSFASEDEIARGTSGTCSWVIDKDGVLTISPTSGESGILDNTDSNDSTSIPWYDFRLEIKEVKFTNTVFSNKCCKYLFYECKNLTYADCRNFNTSNAREMSYLFYSSVNKYSFDDNFRFRITSATGYRIIPNGMWLKEETGIEYTNSEIIRGKVESGLAGTYIKTSNISKGLEINEKITYKISLNTATEIIITKGRSMIEYNNNVFYELPEECNVEYFVVNESVEKIYKNAAITANGELYDFIETINNIHIYNLNTTSVENQKYLKLCSATKSMAGSNLHNENFEDIGGCYVSCDVEMKVVDSNGMAQDGTFVFSAHDIDYAYNGDYSGEWCESIIINSGIDINKVLTSRDTLLVIEGNRIRGSAPDPNYEVSTFSVIADAQSTKITYVGYNCETNFMRDYSPVSVKINKVNKNNENIPGIKLLLYQGNILIDEWVTKSDGISLWLNTGRYILKEDESTIPEGYLKSGDYIIDIEANGDIIVNNTIANQVDMIDPSNEYTVTYNYIGEIPMGVANSPNSKTYEYLDLVTIENEVSVPGYLFSGWKTDDISVNENGFIMPNKNVSFSGSFIPRMDTPYQVEYYLENSQENKFDLVETEKYEGETGSEAIFKINHYDGYEYYEVRSNLEDEIVIEPNGTLVIKIYYKRVNENIVDEKTVDGKVVDKKTVSQINNPKTEDNIINCIITVILGCIAYLIAKLVRNKYSRKNKMIQY